MVSCKTGVANTSSIRDLSEIRYAPLSLVVQQEDPMLIWVLTVQLEAPLLERLGEACTDSRDLLLRELLLEECSDGQAVFAQALQIRPSSELYAQVQQLIRTTWEGAAHLDAGSIF